MEKMRCMCMHYTPGDFTANCRVCGLPPRSPKEYDINTEDDVIMEVPMPVYNRDEVIKDAAIKWYEERKFSSAFPADISSFIAGANYSEPQRLEALSRLAYWESETERFCKLAAERYTEQDIERAFKAGFSIGYGASVNDIDDKDVIFKKWFDQFKK